MSSERITDLHTVLAVGLSAIEYLALRIAQAGATFDHLSHVDTSGTSAQIACDSKDVLALALGKVNELMNLLGNFENALDGVSDDDMKATDHAFRLVARVVRDRTDNNPSEAEHDAGRIAACVEACRGIPVENLVSVEQTYLKLRAIEASRKELFEALLVLKGSFPDHVLAKIPGTMRLVNRALDNAGKVHL